MRAKDTLVLFLLTLALTAPPAAFAQSTELPAVQFSWGAIHRGPGQALAINFSVPDSPEAGDPGGLFATLRLTDRDGSVLHEETLETASGRTLTFVITSDVHGAMKTIPGDAYAFIDPSNRVIHASVKIASFSERVTLTPERVVGTMEVIEISSGRVMSFAINPRTVVPDSPE